MWVFSAPAPFGEFVIHKHLLQFFLLSPEILNSPIVSPLNLLASNLEPVIVQKSVNIVDDYLSFSLIVMVFFSIVIPKSSIYSLLSFIIWSGITI